MPNATASNKKNISAKPHPWIGIMITVDWEGRVLESKSISAMRNFRREFPDIPMLHFLNAAYYTKEGANSEDITKTIRTTLLPDDELGLHIHGWKSLFEAANVAYRSTPTFRGDLISEERNGDFGQDVPISIYTIEELRKVISYSLNILQKQGFGRATSFRAGGWMASESVISAIEAENMKIDHSAVPYIYLQKKFGNTHLYEWLAKLWSNISIASSPYKISRDILEIPNNGLLADCVTVDEMVSIFDEVTSGFLKDRGSSVLLSIGFHQETASVFLDRIDATIQIFKKICLTKKIPLYFVTSNDTKIIDICRHAT